MLCHEGKLSLYCFSGTATLILILSFPELLFDYVPKAWGAIFWGPVLYYALINMLLRLGFKNYDYQIAVRATFLGFVFAASCLIFSQGPTQWKPFGIYGCFMSIFHYSEFLAIAWTNPNSLNLESFILNHSVHYTIAAITSWLEFILEVNFFPEMKEFKILWIIGGVLCLGGEILRKVSMLTAHSNFNHVVQFTKAKEHELVTWGVYSLMRHPSYVGWFWWSIGTQLILSNPICTILYAMASWKFFSDRIFMEEITLLNFFGEDYHEYQKRVPTGLPFIRGYKVDL